MSGDTLLVSAIVASVVSHKHVEAVHQESATSQSQFQDSIHYNPATESGGLFDGVASQPIQSDEEASKPATEAPATAQTPAVKSAANVVATPAATTASTTKTQTDTNSTSTASTTSSQSVTTAQLTASLNVANAPPATTQSHTSTATPNSYVNQFSILISGSQVELLDQQGDILSSQSLSNSNTFVVSGNPTQDNLFIVQGSVLNQAGLNVQINGGSGNNTLEVVNDTSATRQWNITGNNSGQIGNVAFSSINHLVGGAGATNTFTVQAGATFYGEVDGGVGGYNTLVLQGVTGGSYSPGATDGDGTVVSGQSTIQFTGLQPVLIDGATVTGSSSGVNGTGLPASFTFTTPNGENNITISSPSVGENMISGTSNGTTFESVTFENLGTVTINTATNDGATPSQGDTVTIIGPLQATGLTNLNIVTGNGGNLIDLSQLGALGSVALSINAGTGNNTLVAPSGATGLSNTTLSLGSEQIALNSSVQIVNLTGGSLTSNTFTGTVISSGALPAFPVIGQALSLALTSGSLLNQVLQSYGLTSSVLSSDTAAAIAVLIGSGAISNGDGTYTVNASKSLTFSTDLDFSALGGSVTLNGTISFTAVAALKMVFGVDPTNGFYIKQVSPTTPLLSLNTFSINGSSINASGNFGLASVTISSPTVTFNSAVGLGISLGSTSQIFLSGLPAALAGATVGFPTPDPGTVSSPDVTFSLTVTLSSVFGSTGLQNFIFTWVNVTTSNVPTVSGSGVNYLQLQLTELSQILANGLVSLQSQAGPLATLIDSQAALNTVLPLVNTTLLNVINLGEDLNNALGAGSAVSTYIAQLNAQTDQLTVSGSGVFILTDGSDYAALPANATAAQIQAALANFGPIGSGNVIVTTVSGSPGTFNIALQPEGVSPYASSLTFPSLAAVALSVPTLGGGTTSVKLTITAIGGTFSFTDGVGGTEVITSSNSNQPVSGLSLSLTQTSLVETVLNPGSIVLDVGSTATASIALSISASYIQDALNTTFGTNLYLVSSGSNGTVDITYIGTGTPPTFTIATTAPTLGNSGALINPGSFTLTASGKTTASITISIPAFNVQNALNKQFGTTPNPTPYTVTPDANITGAVDITNSSSTNPSSNPLPGTLNNTASSINFSSNFTLTIGNFTFSGIPSGQTTAANTSTISLAIADNSGSTAASTTAAADIQTALVNAFGSIFTVSGTGGVYTITYTGSGSHPALTVNISSTTLVNGVLTPGFITLSANGITTAPIYLVVSTTTTAQAAALNTVFGNSSNMTPFTVGGATVTTGNLAYNISAATLQTDLDALLGIGSGGVTVTLSGSVYTITANGSLIMPLLSVNGSSLTNGSNPASATLANNGTSSSTTTTYLYVSPPASGSTSGEFVIVDTSDGTFNITGNSTAPQLSITSALLATLSGSTFTLGSFDLSGTVSGTVDTTAAISLSVSASAVQAALNSTFGSGVFTVTSTSTGLTISGGSGAPTLTIVSQVSPTLSNGVLAPGSFALSGTVSSVVETTASIAFTVTAGALQTPLNSTFGSGTFTVATHTSYAALSIYSSASQIATALQSFANIGQGNVTVTAVAGQPGEFKIQSTGSLTVLPLSNLSVASTNATASVAQNVLPPVFPTVQGIVNALNTALANALAGTPITIQAGFDSTGKILTFNVQLNLSASTAPTSLSLGSGFSALGFNLGAGLTVSLSASAALNFTVGVNLSSSDFFVQFNQVELSGGVNLTGLNASVTGNIGSATGSLSIVNGSASLSATVNLGFGAPLISGASYDTNGTYQLTGLTPGAYYFWSKSANDTSLVDGTTTLTASGIFQAPSSGDVTLNGTASVNGAPSVAVSASVNAQAGEIDFKHLGSIGSLISFLPVGNLTLNIPITGNLTGSGFSLGGTFTVTVPSYNFFTGTTPAFNLTLIGNISVANYFSASGDFALSYTSGNLVRNDGQQYTNVNYLVISGANINIFAGNLSVGTSIVTGSPSYNGTTGSYNLTGLTPGNYYYWTQGANDTSLVITGSSSTTTLTASGLFQAPASGTVTLNGTAGQAVTAAVGSARGTTGLFLSNLGFSLLRFTDTAATPTAVTYTALETSGGSGAFIGVSGLTLSLNNFAVQLNETSDTSNPNVVLDFNQGGKVVGNPITPVLGPVINIEGENGSTLQVSGAVVINAFGSALGTASFTMSRQIINAELAGSNSSLGADTLLDNATLLTFSMTNVNLFAGINGAFTYDTNGNVTGLNTTNATGFAVTGGDLGLALIIANPSQITGDSRIYLAVDGLIGSASLVGLPSGLQVSATNIAFELNQAFGSAPGTGNTTVLASALDWTNDLELNQSGTFGGTANSANLVTFFTGTAQATTVNFQVGFTEVTGTLNLELSDGGAVVLEANATFTMTMQSVNVSFGTTPGSVDLQQAQMLALNLQLFNPDALPGPNGTTTITGPAHGLIVGEPGGIGFAVDTGELTYVQITPNANTSLSPSGFARTYYAITASVNGAGMTGLPTGVTIAATNLNFASNSSSGSAGTATTAPAALNWTTMVDTNPNDTTFTKSVVSVGGSAVTLTGSEFAISGNLTLDLDGFVLGSGSFAFFQTGDQTISDGTSLTSTPINDVTIQEIVVSNLNLFIGVNGAFGAVDSNGNNTIDTSQGTGFNVINANLELVTAAEATGQQRSWLGMIAQVGSMTTQGLPSGSLEMQVQSLNLLYNGPDTTTHTTLNWAGVTVGSGNTALTAYLNSLSQGLPGITPLSAGFFSQLTASTSFSASGMLYLDVAGSVIATGTFSITDQSGVAVNDGNLNLSNVSVLVVQLTNVNLFVGTGGVTTPTTGTLYQPGAIGFSATGASLSLAIISEDPSVGSLTWIGVGASVGDMTVVGQPQDFTLNILNLSVLDNMAASDNSQINWQELAGQSGNPYGLGGTALANLNSTTSFTVTGMMTASIENYVYVSGAFALAEEQLSATTDSSSTSNKTYNPMSALLFGGQNLQAFVGTVAAGTQVFDANGNIDTSVLQSANALGVTITINSLALALMDPVPTGGPAATQSYFALEASGSAALIGVPDVTLSGQLTIAVNQGRDTSLSVPSSAPAINFAASAAANPGSYGSSTGLVVPTGPTTSTILAFNTQTLIVSGTVSFGISQFVYATGNFSIQQNNAALTTPGTVTLAGGGTVTGVSVLTIGASNVNVFVGTGGPYFNGTSTPSAAGATGVAFTNISFALALMKSQASGASFYALQASGSGALVGISGVTLSAQNVTMQVNGGTSSGASAAVDFTQSFTGGSLVVPTGGSLQTTLQYSTPVISVSGFITLTIGTNVYITGSMAFSEGGTVTATMSDGTTKQVSVLTLGGSNVSIFLGVNGPANAIGAVGLSLTGGTFGLALLTPTDSRDGSRYYSVSATATSIALEGITALQLTVSQLNITVNGSTGTSVPNQVVNFATTDWAGNGTPAGFLAVATGATPVDLSSSQQEIEASGNLSVNLLSGLVQVSGTVAIDISQQTVTLTDGTSEQVEALEVGVSNGTATVTPTPGVSGGQSVSLSGVTLGLAYFTPDTPSDGRSWLGIQTLGGTVTAGSGSIQAGITNFVVGLNQGYGTLNGQSNTTAVNFVSSFNGALVVNTGGVSAGGTPITVSLGFNQSLISLSAQVQLNIDNFFYAQGNFSFTSLGGSQTVNLVNANGSSAGNATVTVQELAVTNATVFAGSVGDGNFYENAAGTLDPTDVGFVLSGVNFVVVKMTATDSGHTGMTWTAVMVTGTSASLVGLSGFSLSINSVAVQVNTGNSTANGTVVNFKTSYPSTSGLQISTGLPSPITINYTNNVVQVAASVTMTIGNFVYISGTVDFQSGATDTATLSDGMTKQVSVMTVGASDVNIFVGVNGPANSGDAMGLSITNANFALALIKPTSTSDSSSYYAFSATASQIALIGLGNDGSGNPLFSLAVSGFSIQLNGGTDAQSPGRVIDFTKTLWNGSTTAPGYLAAPIGGGNSIQLNSASAITSVGATNAVLSIDGFVQIEGGFFFSESPSKLVTLSDGTSATLNVTTIAFTNVTAFVGDGPYFMVDNNGNILPGTNANAAGVLLSGVNLGIALFKSPTTGNSYYAVSASATSISLPGLSAGLNSSAFSFSAGGYQIEVSGGTNDVGVNFIATYGASGLVLGTTPNTITFNFTSPLEEVAISDAVLSISNYVFISGSFSFTRQTGMAVTLTDGTALTVNSYAFGAGDVDIFVGDSPNGNPFNADGSIDSSAVGLALQDVNFGLIVMKSSTTTNASDTYIALAANANFAGFVGVNDFTLSATGINVELNTISSTANDTAVVDFSKMTGGSYSFNLGTDLTNPVGNGALTINYNSKLLEASVNNATLQIGSYVYVQGSFAFFDGGDQSFKLVGSSTAENMSAIEVGATNVNMFFGTNGPYVSATATPNAVGLSIQGGTLALAILTPDAGSSTRYIALDTTATSVAFVGAGSNIFNFSAANIEVQLNVAKGPGGTTTTNTVDFATSFPGTPGGLAVQTGTTTPPIYLDFSTGLIHASADNVLITVGSFLYVNGSVAFDMGTQQTVTINTGIPASLVDTLGQSVVNTAVSTINTALSGLGSGLTTLEGEVGQLLSSSLGSLENEIISLETSVVNTIATTIQNELNSALTSATTTVTNEVTQELNSVTASLSPTSLINSFLSTVVGTVVPSGPMLDLVNEMLSPISSLISNEFGSVIQQAVTNAINTISGSISSAINAGVQGAANAINADVKAALDPAFAKVEAELTQLSQQVINTATSALAPVFTELNDLTSLQIGSNFSTISGVVVNVMTIGVSNGNAFVGLGYNTSVSFANQNTSSLTGLE